MKWIIFEVLNIQYLGGYIPKTSRLNQMRSSFPIRRKTISNLLPAARYELAADVSTEQATAH